MRFTDPCQSIRLILSDVDGVLTDGSLIYHAGGTESKQFHIRDGLGIRLWQQAGHQFGLVTGRQSEMVTRRAAELGIDLVRQGRDDKLPQVREIATGIGLTLAQIAYVGDDLLDLAAIRAVGWGVAVADAAAEVREGADFVTRNAGGRGAIREVVEQLLMAQGRWEEAIAPFAGQHAQASDS